MPFAPRWPAAHTPLAPAETTAMARRLVRALAMDTTAQAVGGGLGGQLEAFIVPLAAWLAQLQKNQSRPLAVGLSGAQGSGKSTLGRLLQTIWQTEFNLRAAVFSLDDLYLTHADRERLAADVHPLLITRGVPGTHDVPLGLRTIRALQAAGTEEEIAIPAFDKGRDDRRPEAQWLKWRGPADLILFEGWCVGAAPQAESALTDPVNELERSEDPDGCWRRWVNRQLAGEYAALFAALDRLVMLQVPGMESVFRWRRQQERQLAAQPGRDTSRVMDEAALRRFIMHYERLTRHMLLEMPGRADAVLRLNEEHKIDGVQVKG